MKIIAYTVEKRKAWDDFIAASRNGTFLLQRAYMDYHANRFNDASYLFYTAKNKLLAVIPISIDSNEGAAYSHQGLTYGGLILSDEATTVEVLEMMKLLLQTLKEEHKVTVFYYKPVPAIYHRYPAEEDLYALFRNKAIWYRSAVSTVIDLKAPLKLKTLRKRGVKKAQRSGLEWQKTTNCISFWNVLEETLTEKYAAKPVHTQEEMQSLMDAFPHQIACYVVTLDQEVIAGCVVYETEKVTHLQYIAASKKGKAMGALDALFYGLITEQYAHKAYFDFGTSVEQGGYYLNEGLIFQKEGFGGRAVVYNGYELKL